MGCVACRTSAASLGQPKVLALKLSVFGISGMKKEALALGAIMTLLVAVLALSSMPACAYADELDDEIADVKAQISEQMEKLEELGNEVEQAQSRIKELDSEMQDTLDAIAEAQEKRAELQESMANMAIELYKDSESYNPVFILQNSQSITDAIWRLDMREKVLDRYKKVIKENKELSEKLDKQYAEVSEKKDEQQALVEDLQAKSDEIDKLVEKLRKREKELDARQKALLAAAAAEAAAQAAAASKTVAQTFETGTIGDDSIQWKTGLASAYGGSSDSMTPNPGRTATGTICNDWSVGVAVPMAWGPSKYYGRKVEISYGGRSIIAPVVDCGDMDHGRRALDLQPGVFKAFGAKKCSDWGVREVKYRFL